VVLGVEGRRRWDGRSSSGLMDRAGSPCLLVEVEVEVQQGKQKNQDWKR
jgi:hypothetical protein